MSAPSARIDRVSEERPPVHARLKAIVLDTDDPARLAGFYADLFGWPVVRAEPEWVTIRGDGDLELCCQLVINYRPPSWPGSERPQQYHLDVVVEDIEAAGAYATSLGAVLVEGPSRHAWAVYLDPSGHPFCLSR